MFGIQVRSDIIIPSFILLFILDIIISNYIEGMEKTNQYLNWFGIFDMLISLFYFGTTSIKISLKKKTGLLPFIGCDSADYNSNIIIVLD